MSDDPRCRSRRRTPLQVEPLESRALLSVVKASTPPPSRVQTQLVVDASTVYVNQQEGAFTVTVSLKKEIINGLTGAQPFAVLDEPLTVDFSASLDPPGSGSTAATSPLFAPVHESVTFPAGASTETVTVPIISSVATPGPVFVYLSAAATSSSLGIPSGDAMVELYSSPDAVPPTITSVQRVTHGKRASAVVLGFSKPMAQATVEDIHNYRILSQPKMIDHPAFLSGLFGEGSATKEIQSFPIAAATYDPSTSTVTLTLKRPAKASSLYEISSAYPVRGHELTDLEGQPLVQSPVSYPFQFGGQFTILVHPITGATPSPVGRLKSTSRTPSLWERSYFPHISL
jgi:hypothetical protein